VADPGSESAAASGGQSQAASKVKRRWTVIASGLLLLALALVVIYTDPNAFLSPTALVVVAAIGFAALLLQVWFRRDLTVHSPLWLNVLGILCALISLFGDYLRLTRRTLDLVAFTDHDSIGGALELLSQRPDLTDVIVGEEVSCRLPEGNIEVHLAVYGMTEVLHRELQPLRRNVFDCKPEYR